MIGRDQGRLGFLQVQVFKRQLGIEIDVVEMKDRQHSGIGSGSLEVAPNVGVFQMELQRTCDCASHPFIKIAQDNSWPLQFAMADNLLLEQTSRLLTMFEECRSEVHVEHMKRRPGKMDVGSQTPSGFATTLRNVIVPMGMNGKAAKNHISISSAFQTTCLSECEVETQPVGQKSKLIPFAIAAFDTEHFLKSDYVCIDMLEHIEDSFRTDTAIQPTALMDVVGHNAQDLMGLFHET